MHTVLENMVILVIKFSNQLTYNHVLLIHFMVYRFSYAEIATYYHFDMFKGAIICEAACLSALR